MDLYRRLQQRAIEIHIEQGPILEAESRTIGSVTGVQGLYWMQVQVDGTAGHAGTAPLADRRDAMLAAVRMISAISQALHDPDDITRFTVGPSCPTRTHRTQLLIVSSSQSICAIRIKHGLSNADNQLPTSAAQRQAHAAIPLM